MTTDTKLLPLPELPVAVERFILSSLGPMKRKGAVTALRTMLREYARANMAPMKAEIEALRVDIEEWKEVHFMLSNMCHHSQARAEWLAEALRPLAELDLTADDFDRRANSQPIYARNKTVITVGDVRKARAALDPAA